MRELSMRKPFVYCWYVLCKVGGTKRFGNISLKYLASEEMCHFR